MSAAPLVMLHGWALNLRVFDDLVERLRTEPLAPYRDILRLDLPGHGRAAEPASLYGGDAEGAWDIDAVARHLLAQLPPRCALLGWSLGAKLALHIAAIEPARIERLALLCATPRFAQADDWPHGTPAHVLSAFAQHLQRDYRRTVREFLELQVRGSANADTALAALQSALLAQGECPPEVLQRSARLLHAVDQRPRLGDVRAPTLVIAGEYDRLVHPRASQALAELLPDARFVQIAKAGHAPFLSHPIEVIAALRAFLKS
ncbi:MAG: alpha/beta fold hydrolase [Sinobacteraceae bacterium]|nr:alpha/beta fold hydrolase [Nevskiaceae bacterium]